MLPFPTEPMITAIKSRFKLHPRPYQLRAFQLAVYQRKHVFVIAPTGSGKSLAFHGLIALLPPNDIVIVIAPLTAIMRDQQQYLRRMEVKVECLYKDGPITKSMLTGETSIILTSAEQLRRQDVRDMLQTPVYQAHFRILVIDEVDCILWETFRPLWHAAEVSLSLYVS